MNQPVNPPGPQFTQGPGQPQWQGQPGAAPYQGIPPQGPTATAPKKKSRTTIIVAAVLALAVIAGAAFAAVMLLRKPATIAAANVLPDNPLAVATIDLNPAAPDQLAVKDLVEKFPEFTDGLNITEGNYKKALVEFATKNTEDFAWSDVEPWLGDSITFAAYSSTEEQDATPLIAIQHKDAGKAEEFAKKHIAKEGSDSKYQIVDDHLLVSTSGDLPDSAEVKKAPLANNEGFKADMAKLSSGSLLTFWGTAEGLKEVAAQTGGGLGGALSGPTDLVGRLAFGVRVEEGSLVLNGVGWQETKLDKMEPVTDLIGNLPGDAAGVFGGSVNQSGLDQGWKQLEQQHQTEVLEQFGISSKEDFKALIGQQVAFYVPQSTLDALGGGSGAAAPTVGLAVKTDDAATHQRILDKLAQQLPQGLGHHTEGDKVYSIWNGSAEELAKPASKLSDNESYKKVIKDPSNAHAIVFVNVASIVDGLPGLAREDKLTALTKLDAVGLVGKVVDDHYSSFTLRVSFR